MEKQKEEKGPASRAENLAGSAKEYADLQIDAMKLKMAENLSVLFSKILYSVTLLILLGIATAFLASAFSWYIGDLLNSKAAGALTTASLFVLFAFVVFLKRKTFFIDSMVRLFISMLFETTNQKENK
jgi:hypothetical protein